jgi:5-methyltetrahydropteroyltriglutamate--homocysteine methyltransferase
MAIRTTSVGSWWVQPELEEDLARYHAGELTTEEGEKILTAAAERGIAEQRDIGIDEWTGGEYFTYNFIFHMHDALSGIEIDKPETDFPPFDYDDMAHAKVVGEISAPNGLGYAQAFERENKLPGGVKKATVVAPWEVAISAFDQLDELRRQQGNLTKLVNDELKKLADAGCPHVQLDAPVFGTLVNQGEMTAEEAAEILAPCFDGVDAKKGIHICNGNMRGRPNCRVLSCGPWVGILQNLEGVLDVAHLECSYFSEWLERDAFKELPPSIELAAGIVDEANYWIESVGKIKGRIEDWAAVVGEDRLWIGTSCGFGRHPARDIPVLRQKVENMVEAASTF